MKFNVLIGEIIQKEVFTLNISLLELSERINLSIKDLLLLFKKRKIDTDLLYRWSCLIGVDFFTVYSDCLKKNEPDIFCDLKDLDIERSFDLKYLIDESEL